MHFRLASLVSVAVIAVAVSACGSTNQDLTDPKEILVRSVQAAEDAGTFHVAGDLAGKVRVSLSDVGALGGSGAGGIAGGIAGALGKATGAGTDVDLTGTTVTGDVDIAGKKAHVAVVAPALFGSGADVIVADGVTYTRITSPLSPGGAYQKSDSGGASAIDPAQVLATLRTALDKLTTPPTKDADEQCGDVTCYHVSLAVSSAELGAVGGGALPSPLSSVSGTIKVDLWARKDNLRPAKIVIAAQGVQQGNLTVTLVPSAFGAPVTIEAPPADQIQG